MAGADATDRMDGKGSGGGVRPDAGVVEGLIREHESALLRYAVRILRDGAAAQDVVQNTFLKMIREIRRRGLPEHGLSTWLFRVAHNEAVDLIRRETRRRDLHERHAMEPRPRGPIPGEQRISEPAERAGRLLKGLDDREREVVVLKVYEGKSYREIGDITGLKEGYVGYILHHALKKLAAGLAREGGPEPERGSGG